MIDTIGPEISIRFGNNDMETVRNDHYRIWVGTHEVKLPSKGDIEIRLRTAEAVRWRPVPLSFSEIVGDAPTSDDPLEMPLVSPPLRKHKVTLSDAIAATGAVWDESTKGGKSLVGPISLPDQPVVTAYGKISDLTSSGMTGTLTADDRQTVVTTGDSVHLTPSKPFDRTMSPIQILATNTDEVDQSQNVYGVATARIRREGWSAEGGSWIDRLNGDLITRTDWLGSFAKLLFASVTSISAWEIVRSLPRPAGRSGRRSERPAARARQRQTPPGAGKTNRKRTSKKLPEDRKRKQR